jgi:hypothetical protein
MGTLQCKSYKGKETKHTSSFKKLRFFSSFGEGPNTSKSKYPPSLVIALHKKPKHES